MSIFKKYVYPLAFVISTALFPSQGYSNDCLEMRIIANSPLGYIDKNGNPTGIHWDFLEAIEKHSGICFNKKLIPYARIWKSFEYGDHDGSLVFRNDGRDALVEYVAPVFTVRTVVMSKKGVLINDYQDLKKLRIGKTRGTKLSADFDNDPTLNLIEFNNYEQAWKNLSRGRIDAIAGSDIGLKQSGELIMLEYIDLSNQFILGEKVQWLQLSKKSKYLDKVPQLKNSIESLLNEGVYQQLIEKHETAITK